MINVTKTYLPPLEEYSKYLDQIWAEAWVTNNGPLLRRLEDELKEYLGVKHLFFCSNGTVVLQIALKALAVTGEVITTPFSYVATTSAILWENCVPVFADISPETMTIDPSAIESKITSNTQAILATHVYGMPCDVEKIEAIARKHGLHVIYDAAHAFGSVYKDKQLVRYGDISTLSFHATKLFHTIEGGAIITDNDELAARIRLYRSFGHIKDDHFTVGINGKNSELHAAMGLCVLPRVNEFIQRRKEMIDLYDSLLLPKYVTRPSIPSGTKYNYSYYPVLFRDEEELGRVVAALEKNQIIPRRYFYPSLNTLPYLERTDSCPVSERIARCVLCLPIYYDLTDDEVRMVVSVIKSELDK